MIDGDSSTRWSTGAGQASGQSITINFGQSENFDKIEMIHDGSDYPGGYKVEISSDGINYTQVTLNNVDIGFGAKIGFDSIHSSNRSVCQNIYHRQFEIELLVVDYRTQYSLEER